MPFQVKDNGLSINIRLTPNARKNEICGLVQVAEGKTALKVAINAVPEDGKANKALIDFLAKKWKIPKSAIELVSGQSNRLKTIFIKGKAEEIKAQILEQGFDLAN